MGDDVGVPGEIDAHTVGSLVEVVRRLRSGDRHVDAADVTFAGSAALGGQLRLTGECFGGRRTVHRVTVASGASDRPPRPALSFV